MRPVDEIRDLALACHSAGLPLLEPAGGGLYRQHWPSPPDGPAWGDCWDPLEAHWPAHALAAVARGVDPGELISLLDSGPWSEEEALTMRAALGEFAVEGYGSVRGVYRATSIAGVVLARRALDWVMS